VSLGTSGKLAKVRQSSRWNFDTKRGKSTKSKAPAKMLPENLKESRTREKTKNQKANSKKKNNQDATK